MNNKYTSRFRPGSRGCEAQLFLFTGDDNSDGLLEDATRLIAGTSLLEVTAYLAKEEPDFRTKSVQLLGIVILLSGSPLS